MPTPHARDAGLRRIAAITGWVAAGAVSAAALISIGVARVSANASSPSTTPTGITDPGVTGTAPDTPWGSTGGAGLQPPVNPPTQGLGGGQAVSGGS